MAGAPNSYCSGNVFEIAEGETVEEEVKRRRQVLKSVIEILTQSESMTGQARAEFVRGRFDELEGSLKR